MNAPVPAAWWPPTRKIRGVFAAALTGDLALLTTAIATSEWLPCLLGILASTGSAITGYLLSDSAPA
jgi:hypothetical protein